MAQPDRFVYPSLRRSDIRLIKILPGNDSDIIRCALENVSWSSNPKYETLSYVWGPDHPYATILLNNKPFLVRRNLWFALYHVRGNSRTKPREIRPDEAIPMGDRKGTDSLGISMLKSLMSYIPNGSTLSTGRTIWIDAICINQEEILERNSQVQMMGRIYEKATRVVIWLGEEASNSIEGFKYLETTLQGRARWVAQLKDGETENDPQRNAMLDIYSRPYWERLWVVQEVALSKRRVVICGNQTWRWEVFQGAFDNMVMAKEMMASGSMSRRWEENHERLMQTPAIKFFQGLKNASTGVETVRCSLRSLITSFQGSVTTDPRDKIYGLLGIAGSVKGITVDYTKTRGELYLEMIKVAVWQWGDHTDHYLVQFSKLLQHILYDPFWDNETYSFFNIDRKLLAKNGRNYVMRVRGILGKRIKWVESFGPAFMLPSISSMENIQGRQTKLSIPKRASMKFQKITAFDKTAESDVFIKKFLIQPYFSWSPGSKLGYALLSRDPEPDEYLCFFKDCYLLAAIVRLKPGSSNTYVVVGRAEVDHLSSFHDWTVECDVEFTLESLQLLTR